MVSNAGCAPATPVTDSESVTVATSVTPSVAITASATSVCAGSNVSFTAAPTNGGTAPTYEWRLNGNAAGSGAVFTTSFNANSTVSVVMTSNAACANNATAIDEEAITVTPAATPAVSITASTTSLCAGGTVTFTATPSEGGTAPAYQWKVNGVNTGSNSNVFSSNTLNNNDRVHVVLTSNAGCVTTTTATSNEIAMVSATVTPSVSIAASATAVCAGASVTFTATPTNGGDAPVYQWKLNGTSVGTNSATYTGNSWNDGDQVTVVLTSSSSCVTTSTAGSNAITLSLSASVTPKVTITASATTTCTGGAVTFTATPENGGTAPAYQWKVNGVNVGSNAASYTTSSLAGNDKVTVVMTTNASCATSPTAVSNELSVTVSALTVSGSAPFIPCGQTTTTLTAVANNGVAPYQYQLDNGALQSSAQFNGVAAGNYRLRVRDAAGCTAEIMVQVKNAANTIQASTTKTDITCQQPSGTITVTATGGGSPYQYSIDGGTTFQSSHVFNSLAAGTYTIRVKDLSGCTADATATISQNSSVPSGTISPSAAGICSNGTQVLTASGGTSYQWQLNGNNISGATASTYTATAAGTYSVTIFNSNCSAPASNNAVITQEAAPSVSISPSGANICAGGAQTFTASGSGTFQWLKNGTPISGATGSSFTATEAGDYTVQHTTGCGTATASATVTVTPAPANTLTAGGPLSFCTGGQVSLRAADAASYQWYRDNQPVAGATQRDYTATVSGVYHVMGSNGSCSTASNSITVTVNPMPSGAITAATTVICPGSNTNLTASGGSSYQWYLDGAAIAGATAGSYAATQPGTYRADIISAGGCVSPSTNNITTTLVKKPEADFTVQVACLDQPTVFENRSDTSGQTSWSWNFGDGNSAAQSSPLHTYRQTGNMNVTLIARSQSCAQLADTVTKAVRISSGTPGMRYYVVRTEKGKPYTLNARNIGRSYEWVPATDLNDAGSRTPVITPVQQREYQVRITNDAGCVTVDTVMVHVLNQTEVFVPKGFTPNRNGANDVLRPILVNIPQIRYFRVYNRWGQLVYETNIIGAGWDGTYRGAPQPTETYTWIFEGVDTEGRVIKAGGKTILVR